MINSAAVHPFRCGGALAAPVRAHVGGATVLLRVLLLHPQTIVAKHFCGLLPQVGLMCLPPRAKCDLRLALKSSA